MPPRPGLVIGAALVLGASFHSRAAQADGIMLVPAGAFWMGSDDGAANEAPRIVSS